MASKFTVQTDRFLGVTIDCGKQTFRSNEEFISSIKDGIVQWKVAGKRGLWVKVDKSNATLVPLLTQLGLDFHHAQPGYVMMTLWMCDDLPSHLPEYANLYIGEDLADTARREVREETGIDSEFVSLLAFRHLHKYRFGCSDMYFICVMKPLTTQIKPCPVEIADCRWMDLDDYISSADVSDTNRHFAQCYRDGLVHRDFDIVPAQVLSYDNKTLHNVYSIQHGSESTPV
ncbi:uncharacterized protein [Littorina saxatilis]|uniref:uncharacterized protein isoform X3 n=1 Tax=Littorina saxatilis TaxID=31220 RepID=UPI0038B626DB